MTNGPASPTPVTARAEPTPTSADAPWPVRTVARKIAEWISRLGSIWVEGQITQISARPGTATAFVTLRDPAADVSLTLTCSTGMLRACEPPLTEGSQVVVHGRPTFYMQPRHAEPAGGRDPRGRHRRTAGQDRTAAQAAGSGGPVRTGPQAPAAVPATHGRTDHRPGFGGRARRADQRAVPAGRPCGSGWSTWPCRASMAVPEILEALGALERDPNVEVIVLARGGGSVEDLLPFSDETLCRAVAACRTPVVSAIGHEPDTPLVDHVADLRCSTPTDAGKRVVPDVAEETKRIATHARPGPACPARLGGPGTPTAERRCAAGRCWPIRLTPLQPQGRGDRFAAGAVPTCDACRPRPASTRPWSRPGRG